jgi:hypothetical protein
MKKCGIVVVAIGNNTRTRIACVRLTKVTMAFLSRFAGRVVLSFFLSALAQHFLYRSRYIVKHNKRAETELSSEFIMEKKLETDHRLRVYAKIDLWNASDRGYIGNQMFIFMGAVGIAIENNAVAVFSRSGVALIDSVFSLGHLRSHIAIVESFDYDSFPVQLLDERGVLPIPRIDHDTIVGTYLINKIYTMPATTTIRQFWRPKPQVVLSALQLLQNRTDWACVHMRSWSKKFMDTWQVDFPKPDVLLPYIKNLLRRDQRVLVFGNNIDFSKLYFEPLTKSLGSDKVVFVDPGPVRVVELHGNEIHPDTFAARDLVALSLCEDTISTVGTYGYWAMVLHTEDSGRAHYYRNSSLLKYLDFSNKNWFVY